MCDSDVLELTLQPGHIDHEHIFVQIEAVIPQLFQKLIFPDDLIAVHKEIIKDAKFIPVQLCLPAVLTHRGQVQVQRASFFGELAEIAGICQPECPPDLLKQDERIVGLGDEINAS